LVEADEVPQRKLIEVALPLEAINAAGRAEKSVPRKGSPATLHLWWSRKPLGVSRAVLFASLIDDPSSHPDRFPSEEAQAAERERLFELVRVLATWDLGASSRLLARARAEIEAAVGPEAPAVFDPFCGGGAIPLEAARLGLPVLAGDLNPVAVLITKALLDVPAPFASHQAVFAPAGQGSMLDAAPFAGLAADVEHYGRVVRDAVREELRALYPDAVLGGVPQSVISWLWVRVVRCPSPACGIDMPLASQWWLSKGRNQAAYVLPRVTNSTVTFEVVIGKTDAPESAKTGSGANFRCVRCGALARADYIRSEGVAGRLGLRLMGIQAAAGSGRRAGRVFLSPTPEHEAVAVACPRPELVRDPPIDGAAGNMPAFGFTTYGSLATARQLTALTTFSRTIRELHQVVRRDAAAAGLSDDASQLHCGGHGAMAYADAVVTYLGLTLSRMSNRMSMMTIHNRANGSVEQSFVQPAYAFYGDFPEANPFSGSTGSWDNSLEFVVKTIAGLPKSDSRIEVRRASALDWSPAAPVLISTDPPYYDMFDYAALANYFYTWIRLTLADIWPDVCGPLLSPTDDQLVSSSGRFGGDREAGRTHFETMLTECFERFRSLQDDRYPLTLYYGYQQSERRDGGRASTAWESMLASLLDAGFVIKSTWPVRTERPEGVKSSSNALASSVVLVCRRRPVRAPDASRREFVQALKRELPDAVRLLQQGNIAPVDLAQSAIGPGMAVFSRYTHVVNVDGSSMQVGDALGIINQILDETLAEQEGDFDSDTRWAIAWFDQFGNEAAAYGVAETLSKAKNTSLRRLQEAGIVEAKAGKVRLHTDAPTDGVEPHNRSMPIWTATHRIAQALERDGEPGAATVLASITVGRELVRELAYRLFNICDQKKRPKAGLRYNALVASWPEVNRLAQQQGVPNAQQASLL
jgi:putative DNA methylase